MTKDNSKNTQGNHKPLYSSDDIENAKEMARQEERKGFEEAGIRMGKELEDIISIRRDPKLPTNKTSQTEKKFEFENGCLYFGDGAYLILTSYQAKLCEFAISLTKNRPVESASAEEYVYENAVDKSARMRKLVDRFNKKVMEEFNLKSNFVVFKNEKIIRLM